MEIIETVNILSHTLGRYRAALADNHKTTGFVPTMGALHSGHISLVAQCRRENAVTVASIFVNPAQFNNKDDLAKYPRTIDADLEKLEAAGCDVVFAPTVAEMYPEEDTRIFDFGTLDKVMEGKHRPGHFNGVAQIVSKLFDAVQPDRAYFGEKDFQQLAIIRHLAAMMNYAVQIVACPTVREADGLAMSSRNMLLTPEQRRNAPIISQTLFACREKIKSTSLDELKNWVTQQIDSVPEMKTEYFDIVHRETLQSATCYNENMLQACIAVQVANVRLIDNIKLN